LMLLVSLRIAESKRPDVVCDRQQGPEVCRWHAMARPPPRRPRFRLAHWCLPRELRAVYSDMSVSCMPRALQQVRCGESTRRSRQETMSTMSRSCAIRRGNKFVESGELILTNTSIRRIEVSMHHVAASEMYVEGLPALWKPRSIKCSRYRPRTLRTRIVSEQYLRDRGRVSNSRARTHRWGRRRGWRRKEHR